MSSFALKDVAANPFRHMDRYPIRRDKVQALRESMRSTGFWDNVVARERNGRAEIAYGHHRLVALRDEYPDDHEIELIIRDLSDEDMIRVMARENMEEWGTSAAIEHETVRSVVEAYGDGQIELPSAGSEAGRSRFAPSFIIGNRERGLSDRPYNAQTIANFLGWTTPSGEAQDKVKDGLAALEFIERGLLSEADFAGLTTKQAQAVIRQARKAEAERERLAQLHEQQAREAEEAARVAEARRIEAERERREREAEVARARDEAERRAAAEAARRAEQEREAAKEEQRVAERRRRAEEKKSQQERDRAQKDATKVGQTVSREIKAGNIGYKSAQRVAEKAVQRPEGPPPMLDDWVRRFTVDVANILDPQRDSDRVQRIELFTKYWDDILPNLRSDLVLTLRQLSQRVENYAEQLDREGSESTPRLSERAG